MASIKQTDKQLLELVLNKLESEEVFNYMDENNLLESDQLYFVINNDERAIAEYDKDNNGIVDNSERLGGELPEFYASQEDILKSRIVNVDFGDTIVLNDAAGNKPLYGLKLYGKTTQDGIPSPDTPIPLINADNNGTISITVANSNLFKLEKVGGSNKSNGITLTKNSDGSFLFSGTTINLEEDVFIDMGEMYLPPGRYAMYGEEKQVTRFKIEDRDTKELLAMVEADSTRYFEINKTTKIGVAVRAFRANEIQPEYNVTFYPILTLADFSANFIKPDNNIFTLSVPNGLSGIPVDSGGNYTDLNGQQWICDEVDFERGVYIKRCDELIFNGEESWVTTNSKFTETSGNYRLQTTSYSGEFVGSVVSTLAADALCDTYSVLPHGSLGSWGENVSIGFGDKAILIYDERFNKADSAEAFKQYLSTNPVKCVVVLPTPIETSLTADEIAAYKALYTNNPITIIFNNGSAGMFVKYACETEAGNLISEINAKIQNVPASVTALPASGTALTNNTIYTVSAAVETYQFVAPASGWAHGTFTTGTSVAITFASGAKHLGEVPNFAASKTYEFDVLNGVWVFMEVVS